MVPADRGDAIAGASRRDRADRTPRRAASAASSANVCLRPRRARPPVDHRRCRRRCHGRGAGSSRRRGRCRASCSSRRRPRVARHAEIGLADHRRGGDLVGRAAERRPDPARRRRRAPRDAGVSSARSARRPRTSCPAARSVSTVSNSAVDEHRCQPERRFVEQHDAWLGHEAAADRQHLLLAAAQRVGALAAPLAEPREEGQHVVESVGDVASPAADRVRTEQQVLDDGHRAEQLASLRHETERRDGRSISARSPVMSLSVERDGAGLDARSNPAIVLSSVDLPTPLAPSRATNSPCSTFSDTSRSTGTLPYPADSPSTCEHDTHAGTTPR